MIIIQYKYVKSFIHSFYCKFFYFLMIYKIVFKFNYSFFFNFKAFSIKLIYYRIYLLNVSFKLLFFDSVYFISYIRFFNSFTISTFTLPIYLKSYSLLRSPFIYSKSREHLVINYYCLFFSIGFYKCSSLYLFFIYRFFSNISLNSSKF